MARTSRTPVYAAYVTTVDGYGDRSLDITPGPEGSGDAPVLSLPLEFDEDGVLTTDLDAILAKHGWRTVKTHLGGVIDQPGHWTNTEFGAVATVKRRGGWPGPRKPQWSFRPTAEAQAAVAAYAQAHGLDPERGRSEAINALLSGRTT